MSRINGEPISSSWQPFSDIVGALNADVRTDYLLLLWVACALIVGAVVVSQNDLLHGSVCCLGGPVTVAAADSGAPRMRHQLSQ